MSSIPLSAKPVTVPDFRAAKGRRKLAVVTGYDYTSAKILDAAGVDAILVGDSLGMVVQGHSSSLPVTLAQMLYHVRCVLRGTGRALVVADLPFLSYQISPGQAVRNAGTFLKAGAAAVKIEGGERMADQIAACVRADIPVMGHVGLTPQAVNQLGGYGARGRSQAEYARILDDAAAVAQAGAMGMVLEGVVDTLADTVAATVDVPVIGIGASAKCDGQVLVTEDMLGLFERTPRFVKRYADMAGFVTEAAAAYAADVRARTFPTDDQIYKPKP